MNTLWKPPVTPLQYLGFGIGFILFWIISPVWILCSWLWWKQNASFLVIHLQAIFYNPWELWK